MHLAYSALRTNKNANQSLQATKTELALRYQAYLSVCHKYSSHIAAIQKYIPGWMPSPPTP